MGKVVQRPVYVAEDGKEFATEAAMLEHEGRLAYSEHVDEFLKSCDFGEMSEKAVLAQQTRIRKVIYQYLAWANSQDSGDETDVAAAA